MSSHIIRRNTDPKPALITKADVAHTTKPAPVGNNATFVVYDNAKVRRDVLLFKFTLGSKSLLPVNIRISEGVNVRDKDIKHALNVLQSGQDIALAEVGRLREGRVDTGEKFIEADNVSFPGTALYSLIRHGFVVTDIFAEQRPQDKYGKAKYVLTIVVKREGDDPTDFDYSEEFHQAIIDVTSMTYMNLDVFLNEKTLTFNFRGRADKPATNEVDVHDGRLGVYPR